MHLQYNQFAREELPLKNPNPEDKKKFSDDTMAPEVLTKGLFQKQLAAPSHVVLNHANCWESKNPTRLPSTSASTSSESIKEPVNKSGMTSVSLTTRVNAHSNKFATITYYKPVATLDQKYGAEN